MNATFPNLELNLWIEPPLADLEAVVAVSREADGVILLDTTVPLVVAMPQGREQLFSVGTVAFPICSEGTGNGAQMRIKVDVFQPDSSRYVSREEVREIVCSGPDCMAVCSGLGPDGVPDGGPPMDGL